MYPADAIWGMQARVGGLVVMLRAFFDETESQHGKERITGVGAFVFDDSGYETFRNEWAPQIATLKKPFHMSNCYGGYGEFGEPPWDGQKRETLWRSLGNLIVRTRVAGFFCFVTQADYEKAIDANSLLNKYSVSAYNLCLLFTAFTVGDFAKQNNYEDVYYTFESGAPKMADTQGFLRRAENHKKVKSYLRISGHAFVEKKSEPTLCSADYIAWAGQRLYMEYLDGAKDFHPAFELIRSDESAPLYTVQLTPASVFRQALLNRFYQLDDDDPPPPLPSGVG